MLELAVSEAAESAFGLTALDHVRCRQGEGLDLRCPRGLGLPSLRRPLRRHQQGLDRRGLPTGLGRREGRHQTMSIVSLSFECEIHVFSLQLLGLRLC